MTTEAFRAVETNLAAEAREFLRDGLGDAVDRGFAVAGRFNFDEVADGRDDGIASLCEIREAALRFACGLGEYFFGYGVHDPPVPWEPEALV